jgi:hypothetical protein
LDIIKYNNKVLKNVEYNNMFGLPKIYEDIDFNKKNTQFDLFDRIPHVLKLSNSENAKLQYFQLIYMFN